LNLEHIEPAGGGCDEGLREAVPARERWVAARLADKRERRRLRWKYLLSGFRKRPLMAHREPVEGPVPGRTGICCSGGGIRSAAFNLGALQVLQEKGALRSADYLAAVSGGSYIAAAWAMVATRSPGGADDNSDADLVDDEHPPFEPGSPEEQYLRDRCDYMAPDGLSKLYLVYRILLGLLVNVVFVALPFFGVTVLLGLLLYRHSFPTLVTCTTDAQRHCEDAGGFHSRSVHLPLWYWLLPVLVAGVSLVLGLAALLVRVRSVRVRGVVRVRGDVLVRALQIWSTRLLVTAVLIALVTVLLPELVAVFHVHGEQSGATAGTNSSKAVGAASVGLLSLFVGVFAVMREMFADASKALTAFGKLSRRVRRLIVFAVAAIVGPILLYALVVFSMSLTLANSYSAGGQKWLWLAAGGALLLFLAMYRFLDITALSLHPYYKRRLCTAFALRRIRPEPPSADPASTVGEADDAARAADAQQLDRGVAVTRDPDNLVKLSKTSLPEGWPTLIVCAAANISEPGATPPGRRVSSFTFSCNTVGGPLVGATETTDFESVFGERKARGRDLTLPAAVAMSGAAIAPSMGKTPSRSFTFLLALANVRLGVWVPNPRWVAGDPNKGWRRGPSPSYLIRELMGRNRVDSRYLFVTDGGHYENLGLVELLRRGCTKIYCFDASGGEGFEALGDAVALARSELGVQIDIKPDPLFPGSADAGKDANASNAPPASKTDEAAGEDDLAAKIAVSAKFVYRDGTEGELVYARNVMSPGAPWDVRAHHLSEPAFPHNSTVDQLYTDQKFESYRALGNQAGERALTLMPR
jgi:hypothetical protein